jgi:hypothetical protein
MTSTHHDALASLVTSEQDLEAAVNEFRSRLEAELKRKQVQLDLRPVDSQTLDYNTIWHLESNVPTEDDDYEILS